MITVESRLFAQRSLQVWFPECPDEVSAALTRAPLVDVMQCSAAVAQAAAKWAWRTRAFHTSLIDLTVGEDKLWEGLEKKTCRYQINKAKKLAGVEVTVNQDADAAYALISDFIARTSFRAPIPADEWQRILASNDIFVAKHEGRALAAHAILADGTRRARALISATADRGASTDRNLVSALNRWLHWNELKHYSARGVQWYDFGGLELDEQAPEWSISQFKLTFGGQVVTQHIVRCARNPLLRAALRGSCAWRRIMTGKRGAKPGASPEKSAEKAAAHAA
ncbi:MAG: GNAT family N-acetyltransferase [Planctomycetes bacterium]|nr:GNAT family N-acetyltransferase [Planctomycetota bacterium]